MQAWVDAWCNWIGVTDPQAISIAVGLLSALIIAAGTLVGGGIVLGAFAWFLFRRS